MRLSSLRVDGLLGRFNHELAFPPEWEFVILHGPNGVGKTKLLELINAVASGRLSALFRIPFRSADFRFDDGRQLSVQSTRQLAFPELDEEDDPPTLTISLDTEAGGVERFTVRRNDVLGLPEARLRRLAHELPVDRVDEDTWYDHQFEEYVSTAELLRRYPVAGRGTEKQQPDDRPAYRAFTESFNVHLIETQRLISMGAVRTKGVRRTQPQTRTVLAYAEDLTRQLREALAQNSRTSQELDRSFPRRVLDTPPPDHVTDQQIRDRYERQSKTRNRLADIAVLDTSAEVALPRRELQDWERRVLWTYLEDAEKKLTTFSQLLDRVQLMRDIVNSRFLFKELQIDRERGFKFVTAEGAEIGADSLSSGEQHELVLLYDLLFNVRAGSTVLIDEPEISLHVAWQQKFLDDIVRIADVASLRFVIATHSPQIIHKWWDRTVALYGGAQETMWGAQGA
jgi:predicted ATP-binding protein involved in virulence